MPPLQGHRHHDEGATAETWGGQHYGICFDCSEYFKEGDNEEEKKTAQKKFKRVANRRWLKMQEHYKESARYARGSTFAEVQLRIEKAYPGASSKKKRDLILMRLRIGVTAFVASFDRASESHKEAMVDVHKVYVEEITNMAKDPTVCNKTHAVKFCAEEAAWLTEICEGC